MKKLLLFLSIIVIEQTRSQIINTVAGNGYQGYTGNGGNATSAEISLPIGVACDAAGNMYFADAGNFRIRKVNTLGKIITIAGNGTYGFSGDGGPATQAQMGQPWGVAVDAAGNVYFADENNNRIRKIDHNGIITTVVGNGNSGSLGDGGPATLAAVNGPTNLTFDVFGNMFIAEYQGNRIRKVNTAGIISTVAGTGLIGFSGDGGPATAAKFQFPIDVEVDGAGNLYIVDVNNTRVRKVDTSGIITTIIGNGSAGFGGDGGPATAAQFKFITDIALDQQGNIYLADNDNHRIRKIDTLGIVSTFAGNSGFAYNGDGIPATSASLFNPYGVAVDASGNIYISDTNDDRVRKVKLGCTPPHPKVVSRKPYICEGSIDTIYAYAAGTYQWNPGGYNSPLITVSPTSTTIYTLTAATGSCTATRTVIVNVKPKPTVSVSNDTSVCVPNYTITSISNAGSYLWNTGATSPSLFADSTGQYWLTVTDNFGCKNSDTANITILTPPKIDILHDTTVCSKTPTNSLTVNATYPNTSSYSWNDGSINPVQTINSSGIYWVHFILNNTCEATDSFTYVIDSIPVINLGNDTVLCQPYTIQAPLNEQYSWNTGSTAPQLTVDTSGVYSVTITTLQGCKNADTILVTINTPPNIKLLNDTFECGSTFTSYSVSAAYPNTIAYAWNDGSAGSTHVINSPGMYWVDFNLVNTCIVRDSFAANLYAYPLVNLGSDTTFCSGNLLLNAFNSNCTYVWSTGETTSEIKATKAGTYWVQVNNTGCLFYDSLTVHPDFTKLSFVMPNIVTPNNDGINDLIDFGVYQFDKFQINIFNRWGTLLCESSDVNFVWKPSFEDGTCFYTLQYHINCGAESKHETVKGFVTLIR